MDNVDPPPDEVVRGAEELAPVLAARAQGGDLLRTMPSDLVAKAKSAGPERRARLLLAANQAMRARAEAVDIVFSLAGAEAVYEGQPLGDACAASTPPINTSSSAPTVTRHFPS
jgi:hypothetical protein